MIKKNIITLVLLISAVYLPFSLIDYAHFPLSDGAEHGAAVRTLSGNLLDPEDPMIENSPGISPRYVPSIFLMALTMRVFHLDILVTLKVFLFLFFCVFLFSAGLFSREYFNDPYQSFWTILALLFLWGLGFRGANAYMFAAILHTSYYPSVISFSLSLLALFFQLRFISSSKLYFFVIAIVIGAFAFTNHPLTGGFYFVCSGLLYAEKWKFQKKIFFYYGMTVAAALMLAWAWPYNNFFSTLFSITSGNMSYTHDYRMARTYLYNHQPFLRTCLSLCGLPCLLWFLFKKQHFFLLGSFFVFAGIYVGGYFLDTSLSERFIFFIIFIMQIAFSRVCREWFSFSIPFFTKKHFKAQAAWVMVFILSIGGVVQAGIVTQEYLRPAFYMKKELLIPQYENPNNIQITLRNYLKKGDVVLADYHTSWAIPVYTGAKIVALYHTPTHIKDNSERIKDLEQFFRESASRAERTSILKKYNVTHILVITREPELDDKKKIVTNLREAGYPVVIQNERYCLFGNRVSSPVHKTVDHSSRSRD